MFHAKKSLGQNFLKSKSALKAILEAGKITEKDTVLEVGPGKGSLTEKILRTGAKVFAVEKDNRLIPILQDKFSEEIATNKLTLIHGDILDLDLSTCNLQPATYKLIANIPYYITGTFIRKFLENNCQPSLMVLMLQREVAKRIVAKDGKESILSLSVKAYGSPKYVMTVEKKYFSPKPKVDSSILLIENISKNLFQNVSEKEFFHIIKKAFSQKRKKLINNLSYPKEILNNVFEKLNIDPGVRAEDLALEDFKKITMLLSTWESDSQVVS